MTLTLTQWTVDDYHRMIAGGILCDRKVELLCGKIIDMSPEGIPHAFLRDETSEYLRSQLQGQARVREAHPITLPNASEPEPDIAIVKPDVALYRQHHPYPENIYWLIEFAETTVEKDLGLKQVLYAEAGIPEYWVVNLRTQTLHVFRNPTTTGYVSEQRLTEGMIAPLAFPAIELSVVKLISI